MMNKDYGLGIAEIVTAVILMSFSGPFARLAGMSSAVMTFFRTAIPAVVLGVWLYIRARGSSGSPLVPGRRALFWLISASLLNAVRLFLFFESFRLTSMANAVIVLYTWPVFTLIFGRLLLSERLLLSDILLLVLAFIGMVVVYSGSPFSFRDNDFLGMSLMLASSILYALMIVLIRREAVQRLQATFWQNLVGALVYFPLFLKALGDANLESWMFAGMNGLLVGTLGFVLFFSAFGRLPAATVSHFAYLEVVFTVLWGVLFFREGFDNHLLIGGSLIIASMMLRAEITRRMRIQS